MANPDETIPHQSKVEEVIDAEIEKVGGGGASPAGSPVIRKFPFAFDTPDLLIGHTIYVPTIGELLYDFWFEINTAWNGTTPKGDIGQLLGASGATYGYGYLQEFGSPQDMTHAETTTAQGSSIGYPGPSPQMIQHLSTTLVHSAMKWLTVDPVKVFVSQDGRNQGADPGSTQGAAALYLVTCTPLST